MKRLTWTRLNWIFQVKLFRLLAINLGIGIAAAALMTGGLLWLDPYGLRRLMFADASGAATLVLLAFGFVVTFGSTAMGTAIMAIGRDGGPQRGKGARPGDALPSEPALAKLRAR